MAVVVVVESVEAVGQVTAIWWEEILEEVS